MSAVYVVMGVSGCGKSTIAGGLARAMGGIFLDADDYHPPDNREKMASGIPLNDDDRAGWLDALNQALRSQALGLRPVFLACSALKQSYRDRLRAGLPELRFIYLRGSRELIRQRLEQRTDHFMPATLLDSQFATLEEPADALVLDIGESAEMLVARALSRLSGA